MITLHDTMSRSTSPLEPIKPGHVDVFVCGPTVYDLPHIGHAKTYTQFDLLVRFLRFSGYSVEYVQNITDVDDKIIARAKEHGVAPDELARRFEEEYRTDMAALGNTSVDVYARAHEHIDEIVSQITRLLDADVAYRADDGIYYDITRFPHYGELSGRTHVAPGDSLSRVDENPNKRNPGDFALWKARKEGDPWWPTPLGEGRPGWHIEDTAITEHYFGAQYDIHGGALDLIFPHHEAEIAQMEAISGKRPLVRHWMHTGFLQISAEKMSKSEGNMVAIRDALERAPAPVWRYLFLSQHYRSPLEFSWDRLQPAAASLERIRNYARAAAAVEGDPAPAVVEARERFVAALEDDLNAPSALAAIFELIHRDNTAGAPSPGAGELLANVETIFGFGLGEAEAVPQDEAARIDELVARRESLRASGDYAGADEIRDSLLREGIRLEDGAGGTRWHRTAALAPD